MTKVTLYKKLKTGTGGGGVRRDEEDEEEGMGRGKEAPVLVKLEDPHVVGLRQVHLADPRHLRVRV